MNSTCQERGGAGLPPIFLEGEGQGVLIANGFGFFGDPATLGCSGQERRGVELYFVSYQK